MKCSMPLSLLSAAFALGLAGCGRSTPIDVNGGEKMGPAETAAQENALAEVKKHWVQQSAGWVTARESGTSFAPIHFLRQCRDLTPNGVRTDDLGESDKMNGVEWSGQVRFKQTPCREAGDQGVMLDGMAYVTVFRQPGRWTDWIDFTPEPLHLRKVKGQWQIPQDTWLLRGRLPTAQDFANAGVK